MTFGAQTVGPNLEPKQSAVNVQTWLEIQDIVWNREAPGLHCGDKNQFCLILNQRHRNFQISVGLTHLFLA